MFRLIPWRAELIHGVLGADLIGFHTFDDVRHFLSTATRILPVTSSANVITCNDRSIVAESFPMGIDEKKYSSLPKTPEVIEQVKQIKEMLVKYFLIKNH